MGYQEFIEWFLDDIIFDYIMLCFEKLIFFKADSLVWIVYFYLGGNMLCYVWLINNILFLRVDKIMIEWGEIVCFVFYNIIMMSYFMYFYGYFFWVING